MGSNSSRETPQAGKMLSWVRLFLFLQEAVGSQVLTRLGIGSGRLAEACLRYVAGTARALGAICGGVTNEQFLLVIAVSSCERSFSNLELIAIGSDFCTDTAAGGLLSGKRRFI